VHLSAPDCPRLLLSATGGLLQAEAILSPEWSALRPDAVVLLERPDELVKEFALGRCAERAVHSAPALHASAQYGVFSPQVRRLDNGADVPPRVCAAA
jgi:hypothetical protein